MMEYKKLGSSDLNVSKICLGTMTWGQQNTEEEAHEQMDYALDQGVNFFDTAELYPVPPRAETYSTTEKYIGSWFADRKNRDKVILASKIAGPGWDWIRGGKGIDRENIVAAVDGSLQRLKTDYIDLYQLHWPNRPHYHFGTSWAFDPTGQVPAATKANMLEVLEALDDMVKAGKIREVGLSDESAWGIATYCNLAKEHDLPKMVSIQNEYSLMCRRDDTDVAEACVLEDVAYLPWSPLVMGIISGKYLDGKFPEGSRFKVAADLGIPRWSNRMDDKTDAIVKAYMAIAQKHGLDICQMAIAFTLSRPFVTSTIIGATNMNQLRTDIDAINVKLSDEVLAEIEQVHRQYPIPF